MSYLWHLLTESLDIGIRALSSLAGRSRHRAASPRRQSSSFLGERARRWGGPPGLTGRDGIAIAVAAARRNCGGENARGNQRLCERVRGGTPRVAAARATRERHDVRDLVGSSWTGIAAALAVT